MVEKQDAFSTAVARLISQAQQMGYRITLGEAYRPPEMAKIYEERGTGIKNSLHTERLAIDVNLFKNGALLSNTESYEELGEWWESLDVGIFKTAWGGRFTRADGNHFSFEHNGVK